MIHLKNARHPELGLRLSLLRPVKTAEKRRKTEFTKNIKLVPCRYRYKIYCINWPYVLLRHNIWYIKKMQDTRS